jgi:hypothetical protein
MADSKADAPFVFEGSVKALSASNVSAVPADERTAVVQVEHVRLAPRALAGFAGKEVTLRMAPGEKLAVGVKGVFYTDSLVFADNLALQSMGHDPLMQTEAKAALSSAAPVARQLRSRIDQADCIVSGQVTEVRPHQPAAAKTAAKALAGAPPALPEPISEHTPFWQEAVVQVSSVSKGPKQQTMTVLFPASTDVKWRNAPKFKKGQKGMWLLHSTAPAAATALPTAARGKGPAYYTALDPNDFHSSADGAVIQAMLPAAPPLKAHVAKKTVVKKPSAKKATAKPLTKVGKKRRS